MSYLPQEAWISAPERCLAWARYVTHGGGDYVGPDDYSKPMERDGLRVLEDLREYMLVERGLLRLGKLTRRKTDRMRRLLLWIYHEGRALSEFRCFEVGRGFPFELMELGETEESLLTRLLESFYGLVDAVALENKAGGN